MGGLPIKELEDRIREAGAELGEEDEEDGDLGELEENPLGPSDTAVLPGVPCSGGRDPGAHPEGPETSAAGQAWHVRRQNGLPGGV